MKKAKNLKAGDVVQFPEYEFAPYRTGWNGWTFRAAIIEKLYISTKGIKCATIRYCTATASKEQPLPNKEATKNIKCDYLFEYNVDFERNRYNDWVAKHGVGFCNEDIALLLNHNII
jgi:hypothetical protein